MSLFQLKCVRIIHPNSFNELGQTSRTINYLSSQFYAFWSQEWKYLQKPLKLRYWWLIPVSWIKPCACDYYGWWQKRRPQILLPVMPFTHCVENTRRNRRWVQRMVDNE